MEEKILILIEILHRAEILLLNNIVDKRSGINKMKKIGANGDSYLLL
jgi:hypothetical protein